MRALLNSASVLLLLLLASVAEAQRVPGPPAAGDAPKPKPTPKSLGLPDATSPLLGFYQGYDAKEKKVKLAFVDTMPEIVEKVVKRNGVEETVFEETYQPTVMANGVPIADIKFFNTAGQKLKTDSVLGLLKMNDTIIVSGDEKPIAAAYLKVIKPDAIIVIFPLDPFLEPLLDEHFPAPAPPGDFPAPPAPAAPAAPPAPPAPPAR